MEFGIYSGPGKNRANQSFGMLNNIRPNQLTNEMIEKAIANVLKDANEDLN